MYIEIKRVCVRVWESEDSGDDVLHPAEWE